MQLIMVEDNVTPHLKALISYCLETEFYGHDSTVRVKLSKIAKNDEEILAFMGLCKVNIV